MTQHEVKRKVYELKMALLPLQRPKPNFLIEFFSLASLQASFQHRELHFMVWGKPVCAIAKAETKFFIEFFSLASLQGSFQHRELHFMVWRKPVCAIAKAGTNFFY